AFRGFAPTLVRVGLPAVIAMQNQIVVSSGQAFSHAFYRQLMQHGQVDLACNEARAALLTAKLPDAAIPVLFMRLRNGVLFGQRGQILGDQADSFWNTLPDNTANGECTPFWGPGAPPGLLPSPAEIAQALAQDNHYPFLDTDDLPRVAQFLGTSDMRRLLREVQRVSIQGFLRRHGLKADAQSSRQRLTEVIAAADWAATSRVLFENEVHQQLADLQLPLYITTNFDNLMALALEARLGHPVRRLVVDWRQPPRQEVSHPHFDLDEPATADAPVVLHLFGSLGPDKELLSVVLTEDDHLDYLARIARDYEYLLPTSVNSALASTTLLFLGYRLDDLALKVILRGLLTNLDLQRWGMLHVAVQVEAETAEDARQNEVIRYFERYFSRSKIDVYWGSTQQFVADLAARWQEYRNG
ncbi:MAG TPA: SIR2 family protein, partial [Caldilineaceae bacterium]|nr:SIR2 family protein [Caldilineaceae bacterium]